MALRRPRLVALLATAAVAAANASALELEPLSPSGGGLSPAVQVFVPGQQLAEVECRRYAAADEAASRAARRIARRKERRIAAKAARKAAADAEAAAVAKHNAEALLRPLLTAPRPLGVQRPQPRPPG